MLKILVVDDEVEIVDFVKNFFEERNFEVITAYNGKDALGIVATATPEIMLLDMKMPVMDGIQTLKELSATDYNTKVIVVSAVEELDRIDEAKELGAVNYITKPLSLEQLEDTVTVLADALSV
jgi:DNA-binding response OmpR family regulator